MFERIIMFAVRGCLSTAIKLIYDDDDDSKLWSLVQGQVGCNKYHCDINTYRVIGKTELYCNLHH